ncbi:MAG: KTSC domain-containing protein [Parabacteroides johnsonii]|nr:KTSC domain-containing protein [Parabacteroides johnsonii]
MNRNYVSSSNLRSVGYDQDSRILEVQFHNGHVYQYRGVPLSVYSSLMSASSKGQYFNGFIRDRYPCRKVR